MIYPAISGHKETPGALVVPGVLCFYETIRSSDVATPLWVTIQFRVLIDFRSRWRKI